MQIKKENLLNAYKDGCDDVKSVLKALFPDVEFVKPLQFKDGDTVFVKAKIIKVDDPEKDKYTYKVETRSDGDENHWIHIDDVFPFVKTKK